MDRQSAGPRRDSDRARNNNGSRSPRRTSQERNMDIRIYGKMVVDCRRTWEAEGEKKGKGRKKKVKRGRGKRRGGLNETSILALCPVTSRIYGFVVCDTRCTALIHVKPHIHVDNPFAGCYVRCLSPGTKTRLSPPSSPGWQSRRWKNTVKGNSGWCHSP